ncbi:MAG: hypothetical protein ACR2KP_15575 [Egibacteraceae bacterium]
MAKAAERDAVRTHGGRRDAVTAALAAWLIGGLLLDDYIHNTRGDQLESFFTPWHGVLYSGFAACALWIALPMVEHDGRLRARLAALPDGYALGLLGAAIFAVGGVVDAVWHNMLGIEVDLEALLSPPHLVLFAGAMLVVTTPARAAWRRAGGSPNLRAFAPALVSVTLATVLVSFFFMYASGLYDFHATARFVSVFHPGGELADVAFLQDVLTGYGVVVRLATTVILMVPVLLVVRRWTPPPGTFTALFAAYTAFMLVLGDFGQPEMAAAGLAAGVSADLLVAWLRPSVARPAAVRTVSAAVPAILWSAHFALLAGAGNLGWPFTIWGGVVLFAASAGYALSLLAVPPGAEV